MLQLLTQFQQVPIIRSSTFHSQPKSKNRMIELFVITRIAVDYFWEFKYLSVAHTILFLFIAIYYLLKTKKQVRACTVDKIFILFTAFAFLTLARSTSPLAILDFVKLFSYLIFYFVGRVFPPEINYPRILNLFSIMSLVLLTILALAGKGYQYWGDVMTFTGGYYFKTDLAISSLILLSLCLASTNRKAIMLIATICTGYIVFKSNARIALPLAIALPVVISHIQSGGVFKIKIKTIALPLVSICLVISAFCFINFEALGMLSFDLSDPFSASNTQGRSVIWSALLQAYAEAGFIDKIIGLGLGYDSTATRLFSESSSLQGVRAHNSFLYLLVCLGALGSLAFYALILSIAFKIPIILRISNTHTRKITILTCAFIILFLWLSMTTEIVVRPQLMALMFLFSGLLIQSHINAQKTKKELMLALTPRS